MFKLGSQYAGLCLHMSESLAILVEGSEYTRVPKTFATMHFPSSVYAFHRSVGRIPFIYTFDVDVPIHLWSLASCRRARSVVSILRYS